MLKIGLLGVLKQLYLDVLTCFTQKKIPTPTASNLLAEPANTPKKPPPPASSEITSAILPVKPLA